MLDILFISQTRRSYSNLKKLTKLKDEAEINSNLLSLFAKFIKHLDNHQSLSTFVV